MVPLVMRTTTVHAEGSNVKMKGSDGLDAYVGSG